MTILSSSAVPSMITQILSVLETQPIQFFVEEAAENVAETVFVRYIVPKLKDFHENFKKFYNEKIKGDLDGNIIDVLKTLISYASAKLKEKLIEARSKIQQLAREYLSLNGVKKKIKQFRISRFDQICAAYPSSPRAKRKCAFVMVIDDSAISDISPILNDISSHYRRYTEDVDFESNNGTKDADLLICQYNTKSNKYGVYYSLVQLCDYASMKYTKIGIEIKAGMLHSVLNEFYNKQSIVHEIVFVDIATAHVRKIGTRKHIEKLQDFCCVHHIGFHSLLFDEKELSIDNKTSITADEQNESNIEKVVAYILANKIYEHTKLNTVERVEFEKELRSPFSFGGMSMAGLSQELIESDFFVKETYPKTNDSQMPLSLSLFRPYEDIGKVISWGTFEGVYRKKNSSPMKERNFSNAVIEGEELTECDTSTLGYKVSLKNGSHREFFLLKCFQCNNFHEAEDIFDDCEKMDDISRSEGFFCRMLDQKMVVTKEEPNRLFVFAFFEYPDKENQWESFFDFMERVKDNYVPCQNGSYCSILQRCSLIYRMAFFLNKNVYDGNDQGLKRLRLIGDAIEQNNIYISKKILNPNDQISGNQILILGIGQDNQISRDRLQRSLKEMLCFALTYSYSLETERIKRLPCDPKLRNYLFQVCQTGNNQADFFDFTMDEFELSCDTDGVKCSGSKGKSLDIRQMADSGNRVRFTYQEADGPSLICKSSNYFPFEEEPFEINYYLDDNNSLKAYMKEFDKNYVAILIPGKKSQNLSEQRISMKPVDINEGDRIQSTVKRRFLSKPKSKTITVNQIIRNNIENEDDDE